MTLEEYRKRISENNEWAPGWEAIDEVFARLYPNQKPAHYASVNRAIFGGNEFLDGCSIYDSPNGYKHLLTYGMTELYTDEKAFGSEWSKWGYEMTIKLKEEAKEDCMWAIDMLSNLARYTYTKSKFFEPMQYVVGNGTSLHIGMESQITAVLIVNDTEAEGIDTVHGRVEFIQLVGITQRELEVVKENNANVEELIKNMKSDNSFLVTDMKRIKSYL